MAITDPAQRFSYWDVAGALTLFGICAATLLDPDQLVRLIEGQRPATRTQ